MPPSLGKARANIASARQREDARIRRWKKWLPAFTWSLPGFKRAVEIRTESPTLYRYRSLQGPGRDFVEDIITHSRLYCSTPTQLNDPLDCAPTFRMPEEYRAKIMAKILRTKKTQQKIRKLGMKNYLRTVDQNLAHYSRASVDALRSTVRLCCFSSNALHTLLWAHYASGHTGVCLHFANFAPTTAFRYASRVTYVDKREPVPFLGTSANSNAANLAALYTKESCWSYEDEYRCVEMDLSEKEPYVDFDPLELTAVTIGLKTTDADRRWIIDIAGRRDPSLAVYKMVETKTSFGLKVRPLY